MTELLDSSRLGPEVMRVLRAAQADADTRRHGQTEPAHIVLALLEEGHGHEVLRSRGLSVKEVHAKAAAVRAALAPVDAGTEKHESFLGRATLDLLRRATTLATILERPQVDAEALACTLAAAGHLPAALEAQWSEAERAAERTASPPAPRPRPSAANSFFPRTTLRDLKREIWRRTDRRSAGECEAERLLEAIAQELAENDPIPGLEIAVSGTVARLQRKGGTSVVVVEWRGADDCLQLRLLGQARGDLRSFRWDVGRGNFVDDGGRTALETLREFVLLALDLP